MKYYLAHGSSHGHFWIFKHFKNKWSYFTPRRNRWEKFGDGTDTLEDVERNFDLVKITPEEVEVFKSNLDWMEQSR